MVLSPKWCLSLNTKKITDFYFSHRKQEIGQLKKKHHSKINELKENEDKRIEEAISEERSKHEKVINDLKSEHDAKLKKLDREKESLQEEKLQLEKDIKSLNHMHASEIERQTKQAKEQENDYNKVCRMYNKCMAKLNSTLSTNPNRGSPVVSTSASTTVLTPKSTENYPDVDLDILPAFFSGDSVSYRETYPYDVGEFEDVDSFYIVECPSDYSEDETYDSTDSVIKTDTTTTIGVLSTTMIPIKTEPDEHAALENVSFLEDYDELH